MKAVSLCGAFGLASMGLAAPVQAQPAPAGAPLPGQVAPANQHSVQEIVVTAQKREERLVDIPVSIAVVDSARLTNSGITNITQIGQIATGVTFTNTGMFAAPSIRGINTNLVTPGADANVGIYIDGFFQSSLSAVFSDLVNVESVEVLKGPQGTVFGRNATGGAILITTKTPSFTPGGVVEAQYGRFDDGRLSLYMTTGIVPDIVAADLSLYVRHSDGLTHDIFTGRHTSPIDMYSIRPKLLFQPTPDLRFTAAYEHVRNADSQGVAHHTVRGSAAQARFPGTVVATEPFTTSKSERYERRHRYVITSDNATLKGEYDLKTIKLASYTQFRKQKDSNAGDNGDAPIDIRPTTYLKPQKTFSQEFNISSAPGQTLNWVAGLYYLTDNDAYADLVTILNNFHLRTRVKTRSIAGFFDGTYNVTDKLSVTGGLRYTSDRKAFRFELPPNPTPLVDTSQTWGKWTPRLALRYEVAPNTNIYASFSKGYKSGTYNAAAASAIPVNPENLDAYEIGFKMQRRGVRFDASAFHYHYSDLQLLTLTGPTALIGTLTNASSAKSYGVEAQLSADVTDQLLVQVGASYTHARFGTFPNASVFVPVGNVNQTRLQDLSGQRMPFAPDFISNASATYTVPLDTGSLEFFGNWSYTSKTSFTLGNGLVQPAYSLVNLRASWTNPSGQVRLSLFGNNVTDTKHWHVAVRTGDGDEVGYAEPATYGISLRYGY